MNTRNTERELAALLHRHAEDAMNSTDTHAERKRLDDVLEAAPRSGRRTQAVVGTVAAAGVITAVVLTIGGGEDSTAPDPAGDPTSGDVSSQEREAERVADRVVAAYARGDVTTVATMSAPGPQSWPDLSRKTGRDQAWSVEYMLKPCEAQSTSSTGVVIECPADMHLLYSNEVGAGPFKNSGVFTIVIGEGAVHSGTVAYDGEVDGMGDHLDDVFTWVEENHPEEAAFLLEDELQVPARAWDRWTLLWQQYAAEYAAAKTSDGNG